MIDIKWWRLIIASMKVAVGSLNEVKVKAVEICFKQFFKDVIVEPISVEVSPQPIGLEETLRGAILRAYRAMRHRQADLGVGIEAGLVKAPYSLTRYVDQHFCAIIDQDERITIGSSMSLEFPEKVIRRIMRGEAGEAEEVMEEISGIKEIGRRGGAVGYLTRKYVQRLDLCVQAVTSALIPRINPELYPSEWPKLGDLLRRLESSSL